MENVFSVVLFVVYFSTVQGFLLNSNNPQISGGNFVTLNEYHAELKHKFAEERVETDKTLALLTNQIQQKFTTLEQQVKSTNDQLEQWKESFTQLESNHSKLQKNYEELLTNFTDQGHILEQLNYMALEISKKVNTLDQLISVQNLKEIQTQIQTIISRTNTLELKEQTSTQDLLALYNASKSFETVTNDNIQQLQQRQNTSTNNILVLETKTQDTERYIDDLERRTNRTQEAMENELMQIQENVLLHACISTTTWFSSTLIKLDSVKIHTGINNITSYISSGKFTCQKPGLYFISASIMSKNSYGLFSIKKNNDIMFKSYISRHENVFEGVTGDVVTELQSDDTVWLNAFNSVEVYNESSCWTIAKIR